ncbi:hypothetical protein [Fusobacterium ulcerans]|uniref:Uncharacterized protein n=1 Tax=Fusobacterium ulcerans 12-1B TaxID=457404 RepID=H1PYJ7_9FUSO|nr:hypothetical protein [Fusobacterium ulcerans]EHO77186.1 hypothetical protein HMPREF0402_03490 [Fusobacterium ulcerans 12-1B]
MIIDFAIISCMAVMVANLIGAIYYSRNISEKNKFTGEVTFKNLLKKEKVFRTTLMGIMVMVLWFYLYMFLNLKEINTTAILYMIVFSLKICLGGIAVYTINFLLNGKLLFDEEALEEMKIKIIKLGAVIGFLIVVITLNNNLKS